MRDTFSGDRRHKRGIHGERQTAEHLEAKAHEIQLALVRRDNLRPGGAKVERTHKGFPPASPPSLRADPHEGAFQRGSPRLHPAGGHTGSEVEAEGVELRAAAGAVRVAKALGKPSAPPFFNVVRY